jgi:hypothetical protein
MSDNCLASVCSLLQTTAPADVIVFADPFIESALGRTFRHNRVQTLVVPEVNVSRVRRGPKWEEARLKAQKRVRRIPMEL